MRRIVLAFITRPQVSICVTGLGFEPFAVCGISTWDYSFAKHLALPLSHITRVIWLSGKASI